MTATSQPPEVEDGRRARRLRNRDGVVDALFDLLTEGKGLPGIDAIAERAGVSVSSIFRYFDGIDDLHHQTMERYFTRYADLFEIPDIGNGDLPSRIDRFVAARLRLFGTIAPIARLARARAYDHPHLAGVLARARATFIGQIREHFTPEIDLLGPAEADDIVELVDTMCSFESWDLQNSAHDRTEAQTARAWTWGITALLRAS